MTTSQETLDPKNLKKLYFIICNNKKGKKIKFYLLVYLAFRTCVDVVSIGSIVFLILLLTVINSDNTENQII